MIQSDNLIINFPEAKSMIGVPRAGNIVLCHQHWLLRGYSGHNLEGIMAPGTVSYVYVQSLTQWGPDLNYDLQVLL